MNNKLLLLTLGLASACSSENYRTMTMAVTVTPHRMPGVTSQLQVPADCPIYTPMGGDVDTPELPYDAPELFGCGVDGAATTYGLVTGDNGITGSDDVGVAVFAGDREIGVYVAFDDSVSDTPLTLEHLGLDGTTPLITAYASDSNIWNPADCCAEDHADKRIPITVVALGPTGMLLSLGAFDSTRAQVEVAWDNSKLFPTHHFATSYSSGSRFYVNGPPSWIPCGWTGLDGTCHDPQPATTGMWPRPGI